GAVSSRRGGASGRGAQPAGPPPYRPMPLVRTEGLTKAFGALTAVNAVTLEVQEGALHSVIGPNGAGKTTFFNLLTGQLAPTAGARDLPWRAAAARAGHRARRGPAALAAGRAGGRALPGRDPEDGGARAEAEGPIHHRAHRAQDRRRDEHVRPDLRHALRQRH